MPETYEIAASAHPRLLDGMLTVEQLTADTGWGWRTILRREAEGMPVIKIGATKLYPADKVREWILGHARPSGPRNRGRPRKAV